MSRASKPELPPVVGGSLPTWVVRKNVRPPGLVIVCPRGDCGEKAIVAPDWGEGGYATRPCTYCFKTAKVPPRLRAGGRLRARPRVR